MCARDRKPVGPALTPDEVEELAWRLQARSAGERVAFLEWEGTIYFAHHREGDPAPTSAVVKLVQGIYELVPDRAHRILRRRIFSTAEPTPMCTGTVKVAARRLTAPVRATARGLHVDVRFVDVTEASSGALRPARGAPSFAAGPPELPGPPPRSHADFMRLALRLASEVRRDEANLYRSPRPVASLLVSSGGDILATATNTNGWNRTLHAEVNLVQGHYARSGAGLPPGARIYTTRKPCKMCAGLIWCGASDLRSLTVYYGEEDRGRAARQTVLTLGSPERSRWSRDEAALRHRIEEPLFVTACPGSPTRP